MFEACKDVLVKAKEHDWIVIDMADVLWSAVQVWYKGRTTGAEDIALNDLERQWSGLDKAITGFDWVDLRKHYYEAVKPLLFSSKAHVMFITPAEALYKDLEKNDTKKRDYGKIGFKPGGEKNLEYQVDTVLFLDKRARGRFYTTVGDRAREWLTDKEMTDHVKDFLIPVCKWQLD